ncbi:MAG: hypothetical protein MRY57_03920 [Candidatus Pacebacteria bacterium]|nr:hypothetical protein [Candidatus Paceibacterota bacterium]
MHKTGTLILMAYPDTFVKPSSEFICKITPYLGIGTKDYTKAGHAALCLIENKTGEIHYYDFGRYITPGGHGRVRSKITDVELEVPLTAQFENDILVNRKEILRWLRDHPEKTHGDGDLYASILYEVDYEYAHRFIQAIHRRGSIPYGIFVKQGSNCARFVADTVIASTTNKSILKKMKQESLFTPSPLGIVKKGRNSREIFVITETDMYHITNLSWLSNMKNFLAKKYRIENSSEGSQRENTDGLHLLSGIGSSAYFRIHHLENNDYRISRFNHLKEMDFEDVFILSKEGFNITDEYSFVYDSNCDHCHIKQGEIIYHFKRKRT